MLVLSNQIKVTDEAKAGKDKNSHCGRDFLSFDIMKIRRTQSI